MNRILFFIGCIILTFDMSAKDIPFENLVKDVPDPSSAILVFDVQSIALTDNVSFGEIYFTFGKTVYNLPWNNKSIEHNITKANGQVIKTTTCYCKFTPGIFDLTAFDIITASYPYTNYATFPLQGVFELQPNTIHYLGLIQRNSITQETKWLFSDELLNNAINKLKNKYPTIYQAANSNISNISFLKPMVCKTGETLLQDDFSQNSGIWMLINDELHKSSITDGKLILKNNGLDSCLTIRNMEIPKDFNMQIETQWLGGDNNKSFGLIIGNDEKHCLKFNITQSGYYSITRWSYDKGLFAKKETMWFSPIVSAWTKTDKINTQPLGKNTIRVQKLNWYGHIVEFIAFYVNDELLTRNVFYINPPIAGSSGVQFNKSGIVGMFSYGNQTVSFDNFVFSTLK